MSFTTIQLPTETVQALTALAQEKGKTLEEYLRETAETEVLGAKSFDEILAPIREGFQESGLTKGEITSLFEQAREEVYQASLSEKK